MPNETASNPKFEIGHVLFIDIVGYSKLLINQQSELLDILKKVVRGTEQVRVAEREGKLLRLPTGDGGALVFRTTPEAPVSCALEIARELKNHPELPVRMGIHSGPVNEVSDLNEQANIAGAGINMAQRVMDCGDAGHILLSKRVADDLEQYPQWRSLLHELGECEVKHGVRVSIVNLYTDEAGNAALPARFAAARKATQSSEKRPRSFQILLAVLILLICLGVPALIFTPAILKSRGSRAKSETAPLTGARPSILDKSIAVLPFENLSDDKANAYFAEGIQDEILTRLSKIADLKVISRTSTQHYKSAPENLPEIAKSLGVANVVEGSVQRSAEAVRVNVQLIKATTDSHVWAETFDRKLTDIFAVESEIAKTIADKLQAKLSGAETQAISVRPTESSAAHDLYLKGLYFWNKRNAADFEKALTYFNQATAQDPNYALAWVGIADVYSLSPLYGSDTPTDAFPKARAAADKAIALDPTLGEPHAVRGNLDSAIFDFPASMREFEKAIALEPNNATIHHWFGDGLLESIGDFDRAIVEHQRALELDPLSLAINVDLGYSYYMAGRYPEAIAQLGKALKLDPNSYFAHYNLGWVLEVSGDLPGAKAEYQKAVALDSDPFALGMVGHAEALGGNRAAAEAILQQLAASQRYVANYSVALIYLGLGEKDQAMDWLEKSAAEGQPDLNVIRFDPLLKPLHGNPRFEALAEKIAPASVLASLRTDKR